MIGGRPAVFISCSDLYRESVAHPVRDGLQGLGFHAAIVSDQPRLPSRAWDPEAKVESYLRSCEAFVALITPDQQLSDGSYQCRPNIPDEVGRARSDPRLAEHMIIVKAPQVPLWSNINPTYDQLNVNDVRPAIDAIVDQLRAWDLVPAQHTLPATVAHPKPATQSARSRIANLLPGLDLGDHDEAERRVYRLLRQVPTADHPRVVDELVKFATETSDGREELIACSLLEAADRVEPSLVGTALIENLASSDDFSLRSCAAFLLWQKAENAPEQVSISILGRLARPATEDWYVQAPAMAAVKQLMLTRADAWLILDDLTNSGDREERYAVAADLLDIATVSAAAVPPDLVQRLTRDPDQAVAAKAAEVGRAIAQVSDEDRRRRYRPFGL